MTANHDKGKAFEREVVRVFREHGHPYAERALWNGAHTDRGDIAGIPGFHFDAKNCVEHRLAVWLDELVAEAARASVGRLEPVLPVLVLKRRGVAPERAYVVMELATFAEVIR
jgi:hypothetical protein